MEPGKDGVGDYTRKLAIELIRLGHVCSIVALMDKFINFELKEKQEINKVYIDTLRLPFKSGLKKNSETLSLLVNSFCPNWISLQYVPFSFNNKGLPFDLTKYLKPVLYHFSVHLMIHEPGIGISKISPFKHRIIGFLQFRILENLIKNIRIKNVTTTNKLYQLVLSDKNINSEILTLFSNIDSFELNLDLKASLILNLFNLDIRERIHWKIIGIFGTLYPDSNLELELNNQFIQAEFECKKLIFFSFGFVGETGSNEISNLKILFNNKITFITVGRVTEIEASHYVQLCDCMISCTPAQHVGKSGVFAFLKLHGLNILLPRKETLPEYDIKIQDWYLDFCNRKPFYWSVEFIATEYLKLLK